jgi:MFS family permease
MPRTPRAARPAPSPISLASHPRAYPLLWGGTASANLADGIALAVLPLLAAAITRDPALVAGIVVAQRLPWLVFVLFSGVIVDRFDRRMLLILGNVLRFAALGGMGIALALGVQELWLLYLVAFTLGTAETVVDNASLAILPELVRRDRTADANGRLFATQSILNELVGPPLGGIIFAVSTVAAYTTGSVVFLLAAFIYVLLPRRVREVDAAPHQPVFRALGEGLRWFLRSRILIVMSSTAATINFFTSAALAVLVLFAQDRLGLDEAGFGLLLAAGALGGIPAGLLGPAIIRRVGEGAVIIGATLIAGLVYIVAANTTSPWVMGATVLVEGFAFTMSNIVVITLRQTIVPNALLGRVTSVYRFLAVGAMPVGALFGGLVARGFGVTAPFWAAGVGLVVLAVAVAPFLRTSKIRAIPPGDPVVDGPPIPGAAIE